MSFLYFTFAVFATVSLQNVSSQDLKCAPTEVIGEVVNNGGSIQATCVLHSNCSGFDEPPICDSSLKENCSPANWISELKHDEVKDQYEKMCCKHPLIENSGDRPIVALSPGDEWEAKEYKDDKGRGFIDVPYSLLRIFEEEYYLSVRQVRCRPPPPPPNQVNAQLPNRGGFQKYNYDDSKGVEQTVAFGTCFPGDVIVQTPTGPKDMNRIEIGDRVLTATNGGALDYRPIIFFVHRDHTLEATFITLTTESGNHISLSPKHLVYRFDCIGFHFWQFNFRNIEHLAFADDISVGDCVAIATPSSLKVDKVTQITSFNSVGVYAPITDSGVIIANNVLASCYSQSKDVQAMKTWFHRVYKFTAKWKALIPEWVTRTLYSLSNEEVKLSHYVHVIIESIRWFSVL